MFSKRKLIFSCITFLFVNSATADNFINIFNSLNDVKENIFFGFDLCQSYIPTKKYFGKNVFANDPLEFSYHIGTKFTEYFGLEIGYTVQFGKKRNQAYIGVGDSVPGGIINVPLMDDIVNSKFSAKHQYVGVFFDKSIFNEQTKLFMLLGISQSTINLEHTFVKYDGVYTTFQEKIDTFTRYNKEKKIPIFRLAVASKINEHQSIRAFLLIRNTKLFKINATNKMGDSFTVKFKDSYTFGIGVSFFPLA